MPDGLNPMAVSDIDCTCGDKHHLWAKDGAPHERIVLDDGTTTYEPLQRHRAEHLRQHPPGTDTHTDCYGCREDAESVNSVLDESLYRSRMPAYTLERQHLCSATPWPATPSPERYYAGPPPRPANAPPNPQAIVTRSVTTNADDAHPNPAPDLQIQATSRHRLP